MKTSKPLKDWCSRNKLYPNKFNIVDDRIVEIKKVVVHRFNLSDVDDPDLYAAEPLYEWQQSEIGKWVIEHAVDQPTWNRWVDPGTYGYKYIITAELTDKDYTYWCLKWGNNI